MRRGISIGTAAVCCAALTAITATDAAAQDRYGRYAGYDSGDAERLIVVSESGTVTLDRDDNVYGKPLTRARLDTASTRAVDRQRQGLTRAEQGLVRATSGTSARVVRNPRYHQQAEGIVAQPLRPAYAAPTPRLRVTTPVERGVSRPEGERPGINRPYEPNEDRDVDLIIREQRRESLHDRVITNPTEEPISAATGAEGAARDEVDPYAGYSSDLGRVARVSAAAADTGGREPLGIEPLSDADMAFLDRDRGDGPLTDDTAAVEDVDVNAFAGHATDFRRSSQPVRYVSAHPKRTSYYRDRYHGGHHYYHRPKYHHDRHYYPRYRHYDYPRHRYYHRRHYPRYHYRPHYRGCYSGGYYSGGYGYYGGHYGYGGSVRVGYRGDNWAVGIGIGW